MHKIWNISGISKVPGKIQKNLKSSGFLNKFREMEALIIIIIL